MVIAACPGMFFLFFRITTNFSGKIYFKKPEEHGFTIEDAPNLPHAAYVGIGLKKSIRPIESKLLLNANNFTFFRYQGSRESRFCVNRRKQKDSFP